MRQPLNRKFPIVMCDIDGPKQINDSYGHPAADKAHWLIIPSWLL